MTYTQNKKLAHLASLAAARSMDVILSDWADQTSDVQRLRFAVRRSFALTWSIFDPAPIKRNWLE